MSSGRLLSELKEGEGERKGERGGAKGTKPFEQPPQYQDDRLRRRRRRRIGMVWQDGGTLSAKKRLGSGRHTGHQDLTETIHFNAVSRKLNNFMG